MELIGVGHKLGGLVAVVVMAVAVLVPILMVNVSGDLVFPVSHKFNGRDGVPLSELKAHDNRRHARILRATQNAVDMRLGGNGHPSQDGLYFAKLGIGNPSSDYYLQVDTGSDIFWVNCAECGQQCPTTSEIDGVKLTRYDRSRSSGAEVVTCSNNFCSIYGEHHQMLQCQTPNDKCKYMIQYGDGSSTSGYFVKDSVQFQKASGNFQTTTASAPIIFGCGTNQSGLLNNPSVAVSGLLGFGQANLTLLAQLSAAGKVRNKFAHCLDNSKQGGGGIWAIGEVIEPKVQHITPIVPFKLHYNAVLEKIEVGNDCLQLPTSGLDNSDANNPAGQHTAIFDSGTTLTLLPPELHKQIEDKILASEPGMNVFTAQSEFTCFDYSANIDQKFPVVKFSFKNSATLVVYPHDYLFPLKEGSWCHGWMKSRPASSHPQRSIILLGDMILSNKVVVYDLERQVVGWTDHNCSTSIKVRDDESGSNYYIQFHNLGNEQSAKSESSHNVGSQQSAQATQSSHNKGNQQSAQAAQSTHNVGNQQSAQSSYNVGNQQSAQATQSSHNVGSQQSAQATQSSHNVGNQQSAQTAQSTHNVGNQQSAQSSYNVGNQQSAQSSHNGGYGQSAQSSHGVSYELSVESSHNVGYEQPAAQSESESESESSGVFGWF